MALSGEKKTVLLVDDDADLRLVTAETLRMGGYHVIQAASGEEALRIFPEFQSEIDLLLTDVVMPGLFGDELVLRILRQEPDLKFVLMSGNPPSSLEAEFPLEEGVNFLRKPFSMSQLKEVMELQFQGKAR
jgi:two-component system cell cycle sensor histidine kinase/response regulator CckA